MKDEICLWKLTQPVIPKSLHFLTEINNVLMVDIAVTDNGEMLTVILALTLFDRPTDIFSESQSIYRSHHRLWQNLETIQTALR